jgi:hypothetical protein
MRVLNPASLPESDFTNLKADELLDFRLQNGWQPTPSRLKGGDEILGHAACIVK